MNGIETFLQQITDYLQKLEGAPAAMLVLIACIIVGYALRYIKRFPNDGIPVAVILFGGVFYPFIADSNNDLTLRVWLIRNALIGLAIGFAAWLVHNQILSRIEDKFGLGPKTETTTTTEPKP